MFNEIHLFSIKERVRFLKFSGIYDIFESESNLQIGIAKEENSLLINILRLFLSKRMLPNQVKVYHLKDQVESVEFYIKKPFSFFRSQVGVYDEKGGYLGYFKRKLLSIGRGFYVFDTLNNQIADIRGDWKSWDFSFVVNDGSEIGTVTKRWAGIGKELFTNADNYLISIKDPLIFGNDTVKLLLAAGIAIDTVFKEG